MLHLLVFLFVLDAFAFQGQVYPFVLPYFKQWVGSGVQLIPAASPTTASGNVDFTTTVSVSDTGSGRTVPLFAIPVVIVSSSNVIAEWPKILYQLPFGQLAVPVDSIEVVARALANAGIPDGEDGPVITQINDVTQFLRDNPGACAIIPLSALPSGASIVQLRVNGVMVKPKTTTAPVVTTDLQFLFPARYPLWAIGQLSLRGGWTNCATLNQLITELGELYLASHQALLPSLGLVPIPQEHVAAFAARWAADLPCDRNMNNTTNGVVLRVGGASLPALAWQGLGSRYLSVTAELVAYTPINSVTGFGWLQQGQLDIAASDVPAHTQGGTFVNLPFVGGAIAFTYNVPEVPSDQILYLSREAIVGIFNGTIWRWDDSVLQRSNPLVGLPPEAIRVVVRADESGTTAVLKQALTSFNPNWHGVNDSATDAENPKWPQGLSAATFLNASGVSQSRMVSVGPDDICPTVARTPYSLAYVGSAIARSFSLPTAAVENRAQRFVAPTDAAVAVAMADAQPDADLTTNLLDSHNAAAYPLAMVSYCVIPLNFSDCATATAVTNFLNWSVWSSDAAATLTQLHFAPLAAVLRDRVQAALADLWCQGHPRLGWRATGVSPGFFTRFIREVTTQPRAFNLRADPPVTSTTTPASPKITIRRQIELTVSNASSATLSLPLCRFPLVFLAGRSGLTVNRTSISLAEVAAVLATPTVISDGEGDDSATKDSNAVVYYQEGDGALLDALLAALPNYGISLVPPVTAFAVVDLVSALLKAASPRAIGLASASEAREYTSTLRVLPLVLADNTDPVLPGAAYPLWATLYAVIPRVWSTNEAAAAAAVLDWLGSALDLPGSVLAIHGFAPAVTGSAATAASASAARFLELTRSAVFEGTTSTVANATLITGSGTVLGSGMLASVSVAYRSVVPHTYLAYTPTATSAEAIADVATGRADFALVEESLVDATAVPTAQAKVAAQTTAQANKSDVRVVPFLAVAVAFAFNLPGLAANVDLTLSRKALVGLYTGKISGWDDAELRRTNLLADMPSANVTLVIPSKWTGLTRAVRTALHAVDPSAVSRPGASSPSLTAWPNLPRVRVLMVDPANVAATIQATPYSLGYLGYNDATALRCALLEGANGRFIEPSYWSVSAVTANASLTALGSARVVNILDPPASPSPATSGSDSTDHVATVIGGYPIVTVLQLVVRAQPTSVAACAYIPTDALAFLKWAATASGAILAVKDQDFVPASDMAIDNLVDALQAAQHCPDPTVPSDSTAPNHQKSTAPYIIAFASTVAVASCAMLGAWFARRYRRQAQERARLERAPRAGNCALIFTDVQRSTELWEMAPDLMKPAIAAHHSLMRKYIDLCQGYEVKTGGDSFFIAFKDATQALNFAVQMQEVLLHADWPTRLTEMYECRIEWDASRNLIFKGLRVRMGLHYGNPESAIDETTGRVDYFGPCVNMAARTETAAVGGQILATREFIEQVSEDLIPLINVRSRANSMAGSNSSATGSSSPTVLSRGRFPRLRRKMSDFFRATHGPYAFQTVGEVTLKGLGDVELFEISSLRLLGRIYARRLSTSVPADKSPRLPSSAEGSGLGFSARDHSSIRRGRSRTAFDFCDDPEDFTPKTFEETSVISGQPSPATLPGSTASPIPLPVNLSLLSVNHGSGKEHRERDEREKGKDRLQVNLAEHRVLSFGE